MGTAPALLTGVNPRAKRLIERTAAFADSVLDLVEQLVDCDGSRRIKQQLIDSATSVASNYRAVCRARSRAEFIAKIGLVREEADESVGWLETLIRKKYVDKKLADPILKEANEITAIMNASYQTAKRRKKPPPPESSIPE